MTQDPEDQPVMVAESAEKGLVTTAVPDEKVAITTDDDEVKYITGRKLYLINASLLVSIFLTSTESTIIATALVDITNDLGGYGKSSWLFTAYMLTYCTFPMIWAKCADIAGRKYAIVLALCTFTLFSGLCGASQTLVQLIMFRWCQGIGGCGVFTLVQLIVLEIAPKRKLPGYITMVNVALALSLVMGPLLGGGITRHGSWRWIFLFNVPVGVLAALALCLTLPRKLWNEPAAKQTNALFSVHSLHRVDFFGAALMLGTLVFLVTGLQEAALGYAWSNAKVVALLVCAVPFVTAFLVWQRHVTLHPTSLEPVFPWRFCQSRIQLGMIINSYLAGTIMFTGIAEVPQRFITVNGISVLGAATRSLSFGAFIPFGLGISGVLMGKGRLRPCWVLVIGTCLEIVGIVLLSRIDTSSSIDKAQYGYQVLAGFGNGFVSGALFLLVPYAMEKRDLAVGSAAVTQFRTLGGVVGIAIVTSVSTPYIRSHLQHIVPGELAQQILEKTDLMYQLPPDTLRQVQTLFGKAYNLQFKILIGFAVAKLPVTALMWTNQRAEA